jgi:DNA-binding transcriptional ArsR family regulator
MKRFSEEQTDLVAGRSRALGDPTRVRILELLARGEESVGGMGDALRAQQSTISKHLQVLFHAGLVHRRRDASTVIYWLSSPDLLAWCRYLGTRELPGRTMRIRERMKSSRETRTKRSPQRGRP